MSTDRYILVTPRVLRVGSPENIHVQAHSDSRGLLTRTFKVNLTVWDFPMRKTVLARSQLILSPDNHFMNQAPVVVGDRSRGVAAKGGPGSTASGEGQTLEGLRTRDPGKQKPRLRTLTTCLFSRPFRNLKSPKSGLPEGVVIS